ncbi:ABC transporter substrate-binding protein [Plantibacter sp. ME-Dv--P-122b]|uniref:ABC transporter substrate-binding protein n=1 Tax=Plantibacter sp. ME-Dv--P-122b TaxID=3040300 RepID=UPI00254CF263|nr:ABC transporter substrate-binding protein [Plantibacter sp. ME-Dv--P-122b]
MNGPLHRTHQPSAPARRLGSSVAAVVLAGLVLTGCTPAADGSESLTTIRFGLPTQMGANNSPMAVAQRLGYFAEEGLQVEIVHTKDATSIVQGIDSGSLEIGSTPPEPILQAKAQGNGDDLVLMYNYIRQQTGSIAVLADGPITSLSDFEGATIGQASLGTSNMLLSNGILHTEGLEADTDFSNLAVGTGAAARQALENGQVDALSLWDTEYAAMEATGVELRYFTTPEVESLFSTSYFTTRDYLDEHAEEAAGFGRAMAKATLFTSENPEAALTIMYEDYPETRIAGTDEADQLASDVVALERRIELLLAGDPVGTASFGAYAPEAARAWVDFALEAGIIDAPIDPDDLYTDELVERINEFDTAAVIDAATEWKDGE